MSKNRKRRYSAQWARYFNHYSWIPGVMIGGWGAVRAMNVRGGQWRGVRRQRPHEFGHGYREQR